MTNPTKISTAFIALAFAFASLQATAWAANVIGTAQVTATVIGNKPQVTNVLAVAAPITNNIAEAITIVGYNFTGAYAASLDNASFTILTGTITINTNCDANGANCGSGDGHESITGLSIPAGVAVGSYNVSVTTPNGSNLVSDVKAAVTQGAAPATPAISNVSPSAGVSFMESTPDTAVVSFKISDSNTAAVSFDATAPGGLPGISTGSFNPGTKTTVDATVVGGESVNFTITNAGSDPVGSGDVTVTATDGTPDTKYVSVYIEPGW